MAEPARAPRVWILDAYRAGERTQLRALGQALGWPCEIKSLRYRGYAPWSALLCRSDLSGLTPESAAMLAPPWPDLLLSMGMRNEPVARWIRDRSGGRTRIVFLGRLWADPAAFDLVITTPQYPVPDRPNVLCNTLPLHPLGPAALARAAARWGPALAHLPRPRIAVIIGGPSGPYAFGKRAAARLLRDTLALARARGAALLVTSSARTPEAAIAAFAAQTEIPMHLHRWTQGDPDNPYPGFLALADEIVVTADSISMLAEAQATGKPVHMFDTGAGCLGMRRDMARARRQTARASTPGPQNTARNTDRPDLAPGPLAYRALMQCGWAYLTRDITRIHLALTTSGAAKWLEQTNPQPTPPVDHAKTTPTNTTTTDMTRAINRIHKLFQPEKTELQTRSIRPENRLRRPGGARCPRPRRCGCYG